MALGTRDDGLQVPENDWEILRDLRAHFLEQAGKLLREAEPLPAEAVDGFLRELGAYFDNKVVIGHGTRFSQTAGLTASRISLVGESDLELDIRCGDFASQLHQGASAELWRVYLRLVTLLGRPDLSPADNPVGPKGFAQGLLALSQMLGEDHDRALDRIDRMQAYFAEFLPALYVAINDFLLDRNVSAAQPALITAPDIAQAVPGGRSAVLSLDPAAMLQQRLLVASVPAGGLPGAGAGAAAAASAPVAPASQEAGIAASLLTHAMLSRLLVRLDDLERATAANEPTPPPPPPIDARQLGIPSDAPEAAAIDTMAMIFEAIFDSPTLPDPVKMALSSLQIPLLRAAMLDRAFFVADAHPARLLLDKMARASLGLPADTGSRHPLCTILQQIAHQVRAEFVRDTSVLARYAAEVDKLIERRDAAAAAVSDACVPLLQQREREELAERAARIAVEEACRRPGVPPAIAEFLRGHWRHLLRDTWLKAGEDSAAWHDARAAMHGLLWSVQPKTDADERQRLARELPQLLQRITAGLQRLGIDETERSQFLDTCFALQSAAMRGAATAPPGVVPPPPPRPAGAEPEITEISGDGRTLRIIEMPEPRRASPRGRAPSAHIGEWLSITLGDEVLCGRIGHVGREGARVLLASPDWTFAIAVDPAVVEAQLKSGEAVISSRLSLFNVAAEAALNRSAAEAAPARQG
ncbi:MAG: DUF1631 domain-containing protein [Betaproteobacteria bacterium]|nr:DUF1631 domain-containing protein [Betaproteobacteria bacterium]